LVLLIQDSNFTIFGYGVVIVKPQPATSQKSQNDKSN